MSKLLRRRPSPAMVVALIALFVSLGGVSYGVATGSIDSRELKNNTVRGKDIRNRTITSRDARRNAFGGSSINEGRLGKVPSAASADRAGVASSAANAANAANAGALGGKAARDLVMWAAFNDNPDSGTAAATVYRRSTPGITISDPDGFDGVYTVTLPRRIDTCAAFADPAFVTGRDPSSPGTPVAGDSVVAWNTSNPRQLVVDLKQADGGDSDDDRAFYLVVFC